MPEPMTAKQVDLNKLVGDERFILACQKSWLRPTKRRLRRILGKEGRRG